jgi:hypothetical protein
MKLKEYIGDKRPYPWALEHGLPKDVVYRAIKGMSIEYASAKAISLATEGAVSIQEIME